MSEKTVPDESGQVQADIPSLADSAERDPAHLVDGKYGITDLVDIDELRRIFEHFYEATGFTIGFLDHPGLNILIATGWRDICTEMHRSCPISAENCLKSNRHLLDNLDVPGKLVIEECENGLVDCAFPIIIKGKHIASLATGQLLLHEPDLDRFRRQAKAFGIDEAAYMNALAEIPVVPEDKLRSVTTFLGEMALLLSEVGYTRMTIKDDAETLLKEVAARKETEEALAAERERLLVTLRSIGDGVITTDTRGRIVLMNKVAEQVTGRTLQDSAGRPLTEVFNVVNANTRQPCESPVNKVLATKETVGLASQAVLVRPDGSERAIADSGSPIRDDNGEIIGVVLVFRDVTEQQQTEEALRTAQRLQSLGILAGGIAHDFNNYLAGILGHVELALDSAKEGDATQAADDLSNVADIVGRAKSLTQRLLTFARGEMPILKPGSVADVVHEMAAFSTAGSNVALQFEAARNLPACSFDTDQIAQVIQNLVLNAKQAMPRGGILHISVDPVVFDNSHAFVPAGEYVRIAVQDEGVGIPEKNLPRIFDPFFTTTPDGTGLGLAICYSIIKKHGGYIEASSSEEAGTEFSIYLPAITSGQSSQPPAEQAHPHEGSGIALVMDDEPFVRSIAGSMLKRMGYNPVIVTDGTAAMEMLATTPCRFALLDLTVPGGMGGIETAREIRARYGDAFPVLAMTGYSEAQAITHPEECGFDGSIAKPFTMDQLAELLNKVMGT